MKKLLVIVGLLLSSSYWSQQGGNYGFTFLDQPFSARGLALGTDFISVRDQDVSLSIANPSLINKLQHNRLAFNQALLPSGVNQGMLNYSRNLKNDIVAAGALRYVNYGKITRRDEIGNDLGTFQPSDWDLTFAASKPMSPNFTLGLASHFIFSQIDSYKAFGISLDFAGAYYNEDQELLITGLVKNAGYQLKGYLPKSRDPLPVELQAAISKKLNHAPFRFSLLAHHLNRWDLTYVDPNAKPTIDALTGDTIPVPVAGFFEKLGRHFTYQVEVLITENIHFRTAFDYHQRQEMKLAQRPGLSGLSFGLGLWFSKFSLDYGFGIVSKAGFQHLITLQTDLSKWKK
ncbi:MAG: type IX secretion system protein PorQ [Bacteroidetes bacterium]|nr:type IX secretion system protein PorQ [Bacteroidota bacterium]